MPASEAQIRANQANAKRSTGPTSTTRGLRNATKHGMASQSVDVEATLSPKFQDRREKWGAEHNPVGESGEWAMDRAVAASFRIERCEQAIDEITTNVQARARLAWDQDRAVEAATIAGRLSKNPVLASRQLQTTWAGVILLIEAWVGLVAALEAGDWSESEVSKALDLLGVDADLRSGRTVIDAAGEEADAVDFRRSLALEEIERLEQLRDEVLAPLDDLARRQAMAGATSLLSKPAKLVLRYEREAWKHYSESMKEVKASTSTSSAIPPAPPVVIEPPKAQEHPAPPAKPTPAPVPIRREVVDRIPRLGVLDELDRRMGGVSRLSGSYVPIALGSMNSEA